MNSLHIDPSSLHLVARTLLQEYSRFAEQVFLLRLQYYRLEMAWQGGAAEEYLQELNLLIRRLEKQTDKVLTLGLTLLRQAEAWEECDQCWAAVFRAVDLLPPGG